jgi:hypothetical protein
LIGNFRLAGNLGSPFARRTLGFGKLLRSLLQRLGGGNLLGVRLGRRFRATGFAVHRFSWAGRGRFAGWRLA